MEALLVFCNAPDPECARAIAARLVSSGIAACVSVGAAVESMYRWKGNLEQAVETPLVIKTTRGRYADLEREILALHPYEVPEIIAIQVERGLPAYLAWIAGSEPSP
jgi:periplasmic divalent cation tolerance protein